MVKGCQKRIYHVKNADSRIFEEAYFVLKKSVSSEQIPGVRYVSEREMAQEAERLVLEMAPASPRKYGHSLLNAGKACAFALGAAASSALIGTVALILAFA